MSTKNDPKNRSVNTHDKDRTLVLSYDSRGHLHRHFETVPGIAERLSKAASAPSKAPGGPKAGKP